MFKHVINYLMLEVETVFWQNWISFYSFETEEFCIPLEMKVITYLFSTI